MTKERALWFAVGLLCVTVSLTTYLMPIPYRTFDTREFLKQTSFKKIQPDAQTMRMVTRAKLDYLISPTPVGRDELIFQVAKQNDRTLYLVFKPASWSNTAVVYAYDATNRKSLWKTEIGTDDD